MAKSDEQVKEEFGEAVNMSRILGLTAMGLVTGALLRLIYQALRARS